MVGERQTSLFPHHWAFGEDRNERHRPGWAGEGRQRPREAGALGGVRLAGPSRASRLPGSFDVSRRTAQGSAGSGTSQTQASPSSSPRRPGSAGTPASGGLAEARPAEFCVLTPARRPKPGRGRPHGHFCSHCAGELPEGKGGSLKGRGDGQVPERCHLQGLSHR